MKTKNKLVIVTYNTQYSAQTDAITKNILSLANRGVQIFCLQEIIKSNNIPFIGNILLKALGQGWNARYHIGSDETKKSLGVGIFWRNNIKLIKLNSIILPGLSKLQLHEKMFAGLIGGATVTTERKVLSAHFEIGNKTVRISNLHLDNAGGLSHRIMQLDYYLNTIKHEPVVDYEVLCGDFNTLDIFRRGIEQIRLQETLGHDYIEASKNISWTADMYFTDMENGIYIFRKLIKLFRIHPRGKLDYIWVKNIKVESCRLIKYEGSDHFPVFAALTLL